MSKQQQCSKKVGELMSLYFELKDFIEDEKENAGAEIANFQLAIKHIRLGMLWAKEGMGAKYHVSERLE